MVQAAGGVASFCKIILLLRALLQHHRLAQVLDLLLDHIHFEEFVLAGASTPLEPQVTRCARCLRCMLSEELVACIVEAYAGSQPKSAVFPAYLLCHTPSLNLLTQCHPVVY